MLSTSPTGQGVHRNTVHLVLLELIECEQARALLKVLEVLEHEQGQAKDLTAYIVAVKSPMDLTC